jgi:hypothetical protein
LLTATLLSFVKKQPSLCSSFHLKVFGTPIPAKLLPPSAIAKKPRKPKITNPKPSSDDLVRGWLARVPAPGLHRRAHAPLSVENIGCPIARSLPSIEERVHRPGSLQGQ